MSGTNQIEQKQNSAVSLDSSTWNGEDLIRCAHHPVAGAEGRSGRRDLDQPRAHTRCADGLPEGASCRLPTTSSTRPLAARTATPRLAPRDRPLIVRRPLSSTLQEQPRMPAIQLVSADYACHDSTTTACGSTLAMRPYIGPGDPAHRVSGRVFIGTEIDDDQNRQDTGAARSAVGERR